MSRKEKKDTLARADIYARITQTIVAELERGVRPWVKPWSTSHMEGRVTRPLRHTGEPYSGISVLLLCSESLTRGFEAPLRMTYRQASQLGAQVRKGEAATTVVYASRFTKTDNDARGDEVERDIPFLKTYAVFNCDQIEGLPDYYYHRHDRHIDPVSRIGHADRFFEHTGASIRHGGAKAFYSPSSDHIQMPPFESFRDAANYVSVLSHEHVHWTAPEHRVGRDLSRYHKDRTERTKDRTERALEELIAEFGSWFLCADLGIVPELGPRPDHASYLQSCCVYLRTISGRYFRRQRTRSAPSPISMVFSRPILLKSGTRPEVCLPNDPGGVRTALRRAVSRLCRARVYHSNDTASSSAISRL